MNILLFVRRALLIGLIPLDTIEDKPVLVTTCYFDREGQIWKPFEKEYI